MLIKLSEGVKVRQSSWELQLNSKYAGSHRLNSEELFIPGGGGGPSTTYIWVEREVPGTFGKHNYVKLLSAACPHEAKLLKKKWRSRSKKTTLSAPFSPFSPLPVDKKGSLNCSLAQLLSTSLVQNCARRERSPYRLVQGSTPATTNAIIYCAISLWILCYFSYKNVNE